jgi:membrane protein DedA with SNARE-associated domain
MQHFLQHYGYFAIFALAMAESMCIPIPSELIFGFAGALCTAAVATGHPLNIVAVVVDGVVAELCGAIVAYVVGRTAGRTIVDRWGKWLLLTHKDLDRAEIWFKKFGVFSIPIGRVIPIVRSVISVPAGVAEMQPVQFVSLTAIGSAVWISVLAGIGYGLGSNWKHMQSTFHFVEYPVIALIVLALALGFAHRWRAVHGEHAN